MTPIANGIVHPREEPKLRGQRTQMLAQIRVGRIRSALDLLSILAGSSVVHAQLVSG